MKCRDKLLALYVEAATKAIHEMGGLVEFKKLPIFGSSDRRKRENGLAA